MKGIHDNKVRLLVDLCERRLIKTNLYQEVSGRYKSGISTLFKCMFLCRKKCNHIGL